MDTMLIDDNFLDGLLEKAAGSERLRMNHDLRMSPADTSQRMLNALLPGTVVPVHRHRTTSETIVVLRGRLTGYIYDDEGNIKESIPVDPSQGSYLLQIPVGEWHTVRVTEPCVVFEAKDGTFYPALPEDILDI